MKYERQEERDFDVWFYKLTKPEQDRWRGKGVLPYAEQRVPGNVFPFIANHPTWDDLSYQAEPFDPNSEQVSYISDRELRLRMLKLFQILSRFADQRMLLHLLFIRTMLGEDTGTNLAQLCKRFGITKQAMFWRARQIRSALEGIAKSDLAWVDVATARKQSASETARVLKQAKTPDNGGVRNLLAPPLTKRVAARPGVILRKPSKKRPRFNK
jgi:transposase-like protein